MFPGRRRFNGGRSTFASNLVPCLFDFIWSHGTVLSEALVMSGVDIYTVSKLLGHHDVKITEKHYAHLTPNFPSQSITRLNLAPYQQTALE